MITFGQTDAIVPLGYIWHNLSLAHGTSKITSTFYNGRLKFKNIRIDIGKVYKVSCKVAYPTAANLSNDETFGFGFITLIFQETIIIKSQAIFRQGFDSLMTNKQIISNEYIKEIDNSQPLKRHRGFTAFRSFQNTFETGY